MTHCYSAKEMRQQQRSLINWNSPLRGHLDRGVFSLDCLVLAFFSAPTVGPSALVSCFSSILSFGRGWHHHIVRQAGSGGTLNHLYLLQLACYRQLGQPISSYPTVLVSSSLVTPIQFIPSVLDPYCHSFTWCPATRCGSTDFCFPEQLPSLSDITSVCRCPEEQKQYLVASYFAINLVSKGNS